MIRVAVLFALTLFLFSLVTFAQGATFGSIQSGEFSDPSSWEIIEGTDLDGIPDRHDSLIINAEHEIIYFGRATESVIHDIEIAAGGALKIDEAERQIFWTTGRVLVHGNLEVTGPHRLIFDSTEEYLSGIRVMSGATFAMHGVERMRGFVNEQVYLGNRLAEIQLFVSDLEPHALQGQFVKMLDGKSKSMIYQIIDNDEDSITIQVDSILLSDNAGSGESFKPLTAKSNKMRVELDILSAGFMTSREGHSTSHVGQWIRALPSTNEYLIVGAKRRDSEGLLTLDHDLHETDLESEFLFLNGIASGDQFVIYQPAEATVPVRNMSDGISQSMLVASNADVDLYMAKFSYFGSHIGNRTRFGGWTRSTAGLAFLNMKSLNLFHSEFYHTAAASNVHIEGSSNLRVAHNVIAHAHPAINPTGELQVGHGFVFFDIKGLVFQDNVVMNMDDDLVYVGRNSTDLQFIDNKLINTPVIRGNSANSLEVVSKHPTPSVTVKNNLMINAHVNLNILFHRPGGIELSNNTIASTVRWRSANVVLQNVNGIYENNRLYNAPAGIVVRGNSQVDVRPNAYSGHYIDAIDKRVIQRNSWISLGILALGFLIVARVKGARFKWIVRGIYVLFVVANIGVIGVAFFLM